MDLRMRKVSLPIFGYEALVILELTGFPVEIGNTIADVEVVFHQAVSAVIAQGIVALFHRLFAVRSRESCK